MHRVSWLGLGFIGFGAFVLAIAIPFAVTSPSNVQNIVLSPTFWPTIVAWLIIGLGGLLTVLRFAGSGMADADEDDVGDSGAAAWLRIVGAVAVMAGQLPPSTASGEKRGASQSPASSSSSGRTWVV